MRASLKTTTVLATVAALAVLPAAAASATGDTEAPKIASVSAPSIVGLTNQGAVFTIDVNASDNIDIARVVVGIIDTTGRYTQPIGFEAKLAKGMSWDGTYRATITMPKSVPMGLWTVRAFAVDNAGNRSTGVNAVRDSFVLKYATKIAKLAANPAKVTKGGTVTVTGVLQQAVASGWAPYAAKAVKVQFRKAGTTPWLTVGTATSGPSGKFLLATKAKRAGDWRAIYAGDSNRAKATSKIDSVALAH